ncbi:MAG: hypothetical protein DRP22_00675 [Verrucomicrobia bacterium]|nr:MAG: hypothetical protein DRP22_00675 [Verrucomicrobiota bacterium]
MRDPPLRLRAAGLLAQQRDRWYGGSGGSNDMGVKGIFQCRRCGHRFRARAGGGFNFRLFRCEDCDRTVVVGNPIWPDMPGTGDPVPEKCEYCGGRMRDDIPPMCRKCRSRDVELVVTEMLYD